jgi:hypothetical protein
MNKYKRYHIGVLYHGYQVFLTCVATSYKQAAEKFELSEYFVKGYAGVVKTDDYFEGIRGYIDSGWIIFDFNRQDLSRKEMAYDELKVIIDEYNKKKHEKDT